MADINVGAISEALNNKADLDLHNLNNEGKKSVTLTGMVMAFAGTTAPTGWLKCDGSAISRTTYAALFNVIGTTYGAGDGSTTFNLPTQSVLPLGTSAIVTTSSTEHRVANTPTLRWQKSDGSAAKYGQYFCLSIDNATGNGTRTSRQDGSNATGHSGISPSNLIVDLTQITGAKAIACIKY